MGTCTHRFKTHTHTHTRLQKESRAGPAGKLKLFSEGSYAGLHIALLLLYIENELVRSSGPSSHDYKYKSAPSYISRIAEKKPRLLLCHCWA